MENKCVANNGGDLPRKEKVTELELTFRVIDGKSYYSIKYKKVGENHYHIGYSSYSFENVLRWKDECFEVVDKPQTNGDRIRNMTDEELAETLFGSCIERMGVEKCLHLTENLEDVPNCKSCILKWLQKESEG